MTSRSRGDSPTLVTAVLVGNNMPVKQGQPLFQFDRRPYEFKVRQLEAELAHTKQTSWCCWPTPTLPRTR